jgi:haloalkane dehalogenase
MKTKLLLTSVCRPFGGPGEGDSVGAELFHAQVTRAQGPFSLRQVIRVWALDYLAENVQAPTVTLHYPSRRELVRELCSGDYTHVGINFVVATFHKLREMVPLIRQHAPRAKIILGGYGTVLPDELLRPFGDAICREEGVRFLRRTLGEPEAGPVRHPHAPIPSVSILSYQLPSVVGHVTAGLGCSNGCDFCCTSHFFRQKYVPFSSTGREIYESLLATRRRARAEGQIMKGFVLIDEDFFLHQRRAREFLDCVREGGEALSIMGFGSVRGLSQFSAREIAEMGFDLIWNAFEGAGAGYRKQQGKSLAELYAELKAVGCAQLTSMIIGFPYQTEQIIWQELEQLMALEPALVQCLIYFAFPGTPFHQQVIAENRYRERYRKGPDLRRWDGFAMHFSHPHFQRPERVEELQREIYAADFARLGPSPLRLARVWLTGYENLRKDASPLLRQRAERLREDVRATLPLTRAAMAFGPSREARAQARRLRRDIVRLTGEPSVRERALEAGAPALYLASRLTRALGILQQPGLLRTEHRGGTPVAARPEDVFRLQGGLHAGLLRALAEDLSYAGQRQRAQPDTGSEHGIVTARAQAMAESVPLSAAG